MRRPLVHEAPLVAMEEITKQAVYEPLDAVTDPVHLRNDDHRPCNCATLR
jgi:hypothetical protein